jgi:NADPH-dependent curcumin reductase CurA
MTTWLCTEHTFHDRHSEVVDGIEARRDAILEANGGFQARLVIVGQVRQYNGTEGDDRTRVTPLVDGYRLAVT